MVNYLKKTKMYELAKTLVSDMPVMRSCEYRFFRGTEWLRFHDDNYIYELCRMGVYVSLDIYIYDEDLLKRVEINRICYDLIDGQLKEVYRRVS